MKPYTTADEAARAAILKINPISISKKWEYAGRIYQKGNNFFYTEAKTLRNPNNSDPGHKIVGTNIINIGTYHTHGGAFDPTDEEFSPDDKWKATFGKEISYLGTPLKKILKFTPIDLLSDLEQKIFLSGKVEDITDINNWGYHKHCETQIY